MSNSTSSYTTSGPPPLAPKPSVKKRPPLAVSESSSINTIQRSTESVSDKAPPPPPRPTQSTSSSTATTPDSLSPAPVEYAPPPVFRILRKPPAAEPPAIEGTAEAQQREEDEDRSKKKRRSTEPSLPGITPGLALKPNDAAASKEAEVVQPYRILAKKRVVDSSLEMSDQSSSEEDSDEGGNLPEFRMLRDDDDSFSFGPPPDAVSTATDYNKKAAVATKSEPPAPKKGGGNVQHGAASSSKAAGGGAKADLDSLLDAMVPSSGKSRNAPVYASVSSVGVAPPSSSSKQAKKPAAFPVVDYTEQLYKAPLSNEMVRVPTHILFQVSRDRHCEEYFVS